MPSDKPVSAVDLPRECYPFTVQFFRLSDDTEIEEHRIEVEGGPVLIEVPGLKEKYGETWCRISYATGQVVEAPTKEEREIWKRWTTDTE